MGTFVLSSGRGYEFRKFTSLSHRFLLHSSLSSLFCLQRLQAPLTVPSPYFEQHHSFQSTCVLDHFARVCVCQIFALFDSESICLPRFPISRTPFLYSFSPRSSDSEISKAFRFEQASMADTSTAKIKDEPGRNSVVSESAPSPIAQLQSAYIHTHLEKADQRKDALNKGLITAKEHLEEGLKIS